MTDTEETEMWKAVREVKGDWKVSFPETGKPWKVQLWEVQVVKESEKNAAVGTGKQPGYEASEICLFSFWSDPLQAGLEVRKERMTITGRGIQVQINKNVFGSWIKVNREKNQSK